MLAASLNKLDIVQLILERNDVDITWRDLNGVLSSFNTLAMNLTTDEEIKKLIQNYSPK